MIITGIYIMVCLAILFIVIADYKRTSKEDTRIVKLTKENIIRKRIDTQVKKHIKQEKVDALQKLYLQADWKFSIYKHYALCLCVALLFATLSYAYFHNELISVALFVYGCTFPRQVLIMIRNKRAEVLENQIITFMEMNNARFSVSNNLPECFQRVEEDMSRKHIQPIGKILHDCNMLVQGGMPFEDMLNIFAIKCNSKYARIYVNFLLNTNKINSPSAKNKLLKKCETKAVRQRDFKRLQHNKINASKKACYILMCGTPALAFVEANTVKGWTHFMKYDPFGKIEVAIVFIILAVAFVIIEKKLSVYEEK